MMDYIFMPVNSRKIPPVIKDNITLHKEYHALNVRRCVGGVYGDITLDNGVMFNIWPETRVNGFIAKRIYTKDDNEADPVLREWGLYTEYADCGDLDSDLSNWLRTQIVADLDHDYSQNFKLGWRIRTFQPMRSKIAAGKISVYMTQQARDDDKQTAMRPGRALSFMFPELEHSEIITLVDNFLNTFAAQALTLHASKEADEFAYAYSGQQSPNQNINTTSYRKHSSDSCMRYDFPHLPVHPATAYASGDFEIVYATDQDNLVAGRCVVYLNEGGTPQAGPIYGVSEQALDFILEHLESKGCELHADWEGARLKRIPKGDDEFIAPYLDPHPQSLDDDGDYLVVSRGGEIDASQYSGVLGGCFATCHECGENLQEDDACYSEYTGGYYCEICFDNLHFYCGITHESCHNEQGVDVYYINSYGRTNSRIVSEYGAENSSDIIWCFSDNAWWDDDGVHYCESSGEYIDPITYKADYFASDWDGEVYPNEEKCTTEDGHTVSFSEIDMDIDDWYKNKDGIWCKKEDE